jgi:hypothetical protein
MAERQKRTKVELREMIMREVRKRPEFRNIQDVVIERPLQVAPSLPNWRCSWVMIGAASVPASVDEVAWELQGQFDLA